MVRLISTSLVFICIAIGQIDAAAAFKNTSVGTVAHDFTLNSLEGVPLRLSDALGEQATIVVFWATWSSRSLDALRDLEQLHTRYADKGLVVLSVNVDGEGYVEQRRNAISNTVEDLGLSYPVLVDEDLTVYATYGVMATPSIVLAGPKGTVTEILDGYASAGRAEFHEKVLTAMGVSAPSREGQTAVKDKRQARDNAERYLRMGRLLQNKGRTKGAIRYFSLAVVEDPMNEEACQTLAAALQRVGRLNEAERVLAQVNSLGNP